MTAVRRNLAVGCGRDEGPESTPCGHSRPSSSSTPLDPEPTAQTDPIRTFAIADERGGPRPFAVAPRRPMNPIEGNPQHSSELAAANATSSVRHLPRQRIAATVKAVPSGAPLLAFRQPAWCRATGQAAPLRIRFADSAKLSTLSGICDKFLGKVGKALSTRYSGRMTCEISGFGFWQQ
jgi:hypothetical protein